MSKKKKSEDLAYFIIILFLASIALAYFMDADMDMQLERRVIAHHTSIVLNFMGTDSEVYEHFVRVPKINPEKEAISQVLYTYNLERFDSGTGVEFGRQTLHPDTARSLQLYLDSLNSQGLQTYFSPATIITFGTSAAGDRILVEADIVPECVGWIGMFAVSALIIAYPGVKWRKRFLGFVMVWPIMYVVNVLRISTTVYSGFIGGPTLIDFTHDFGWRVVLVSLSIILWLGWVWFVVKEKSFADLRNKLFKA
jgi:exosortase/archaeosortase family protein